MFAAMLALKLFVVCGLVFSVVTLASVLLRTPPSKHGRRRGVRHGLPTEIRRHRQRGHHTWERTLSLRVVEAATQHALDELDTTAERRRYAAANRYEGTVEITRTDLEAILGPRPAELVAA